MDQRHETFMLHSRWPSLDGLRALAILPVVWHHAGGGSMPGILGRGNWGVALFFAISGVLITSLLLREERATGRISMRAFYARRTLRIFPVYYAVLGLYTVLALASHASPKSAEFLSRLPYFATYTSNWFVFDGLFVIAWSLATEEQFYLTWPTLLRVARSPRARALAIAGLLAVSETAIWGVKFGWWTHDPLIVRILTSIASPICLGALAAIAIHTRRGFALAMRVAGYRWSAPLGLALALAGIALDSGHASVVALTYLVLACVLRQDNGLAPILETRPLMYIGKVSYGMYLLHSFAISAAIRLLPPTAPALLVFALALPVTLALAGTSYRWFEQPILRLKERFRALPVAVAPPRASQPVGDARIVSVN